jgi:anti-sigma factor RsiW
MRSHLEDHELAAALAGDELEATAAEHLQACVACRRELDELRRMVASRREQQAVAEPDWDSQHRRIMDRLQPPAAAVSPSRRRWLRPLLAAAATLILAVGLRTVWWPAPVAEQPLEPDFQVEQILAEVEAVLDDESLPGFEAIDPGLDDPEGLFENGAS